MNKILDDQSKFRRLGPVSSNDNTAIVESRLQKRLLDLVKADHMPKWIYDAIRPTGSQRPRMYCLPKNIINTQITKKTAQFSTLKRFGPEKCPVYLRVPWIGKPSTNLEKEVKTAVESCYGSVSTRLVFTSKRMLPVARKDVLPAIQKSFVIYEYKCHCDSRYVGRTSQRLQDRIKQHVPQWLRQQLTRPRRSQPHRSCKRTDTKPDCDSAIGQHLLDNDRCALNYDDKRFSILAAARSSFHLNLLEATYIKTRRPVLCRQKEFVYTLKLFR